MHVTRRAGRQALEGCTAQEPVKAPEPNSVPPGPGPSFVCLVFPHLAASFLRIPKRQEVQECLLFG